MAQVTTARSTNARKCVSKSTSVPERRAKRCL